MASTKIFNSESDENNWIFQIKDMVEKTDLRYLNTIPVSIYHVPKSLSSANRECFVPQLVAIGPYNHFLPELHPMERLKVYSAKRVLEHFHQDTLEQMVKKLWQNNSGTHVRACYHKYIHIGEETLLYIMAIDGLFMLDFLHDYPKDRIFTGLQQMFQSGVKLTKDAIVRDVMMLENQIPTYLLKEILQTEGSKFRDSVDEQLGSMLLGFCIEHCLFKLKKEARVKPSEAAEHPHLLALLYHLIVSQDGENSEWPATQHEGILNWSKSCSRHEQAQNMSASSSNYNYYRQKITFYLGKLKPPLAWTANFLETQKNKNIPLLKPFKGPIEIIVKVLKHDWSSSSVSDAEAPVVVMIPSVTELHDAGIRFKPAAGGINAIEFDYRRGILYLPVIKLDVNTEVILRNIVAYEALTKSDFLIFTRYIELMRAIVDTVEDVEQLMEDKIIDNHISEEEATDMFNGMSKSIGPTETEKLDKTIEKVNRHFDNCQKIRSYRLLTNYVYSSWKFFTLLGTLVLLGLTGLQTFCTVYDCPSLLKAKAAS